MKQVIFDGRLGKDAEVITTVSGQQYIRFSVANNIYSRAEGEKTDWMDVVCFDPFLIKNKQAILKKGCYVIVTGSLEVGSNVLADGRTFVNQRVHATSIDIPSLGKPEGAQVTEGTQAAQAPQQAAPQVAPQPQMMPQYQANVPQYQANVPQYQANVPQYQAPMSGASDGNDLPF